MAVVALPAALSAQMPATNTADWARYRSESGEYTIKHPNTLRVSVPNGKSCSSNGECKPIEQVMLMGSDSQDGKSSVTSMSFIIQRGINPNHLAIRQWYESLAGRALQPDSETVISAGGKSAVLRGSLAQSASAGGARDKAVVGGGAAMKVNTVYVAINEADVLTISSPAGSALSETYTAVLSTLKFTGSKPR